MAGNGYHHGDLRRAVLAAATEAISEDGVAALSLRDLARRAGVSHAAPAHHFGDRSGLLTALATDGYTMLGDALTAAGPQLLEQGVAYVRFAVAHPAHFEVMFRPQLYRADDPELLVAQRRATQALSEGVAAEAAAGDGVEVRVAAWSIVHGFATLWLAGALAPELLDQDPGEVACRAIRLLFDHPKPAP